jgi:hypothetical protein
MRKRVCLSELKEIGILWPGDVHALADFILHAFDARDREANAVGGVIRKSRPTVRGLAGYYSQLTDTPSSRIERELQARGLDLGAVLDSDSAGREPDRT